MQHFPSHRCRRVVYTVYSIDARTGFWKGFSRPARFIILAQTLVIGFLSFWVYQEYLNNLYLRIYVNNMIQTAGWAFAVLAAIVLLGAVTTAISRSKNAKKVEPETVETMAMEVETLAPTSTQTPVRAPIDLHPMVAQLKADLAGTHMPIESVPVSKLEETPAPLAVQPPATNTPAPPTQSTPSTVIIGMVPVQKKEEKQVPAEEKHTEEEQKATDEAKGPPNS